MGYMPSPNTLTPAEDTKEPTTPQGPPPGPIPMGYLPSEVNKETNGPLVPPTTNEVDANVTTKAPTVKELQPPAPPQRNRTPPQQIPLKEENGMGVPQHSKSEGKT